MPFTVFCTKYALTQGILTMEVDHCPSDPGIVKPKDNRCIYLHNPDWHHTLDEAKVRVRTMIQNERQRIQRKLDHLTQLEQSLGD